VSEPGEVAHRAPLLIGPATLLAALLIALWLAFDPRTPDLAAQVYRVSLFRHEGFAVWDLHWYAGHALPGYSLLFPPLAVLLGMRVVAALAVLVTAVLGERLLVGLYGEAGRWGAVWLAVAAVADLWVGRLTFALGVAFAVACLLAFVRRRPVLAATLALLCAAASPVAGVLLALLALTLALSRRSVGALLIVAAPACTLVIALALLFPEDGWEPYPTTSFLATVAVVLGFLWALPAGQRKLRLGAAVYLAACVLLVALHTPMGANAERYGLLLAGPLLLCTLSGQRDGGRSDGGGPDGGGPEVGRRRTARGRLSGVAIGVLCGIALWTVWGPLRESVAVAGDPSTTAAYYVPLKRFLATHGGDVERVEVPFTRSHWEAAWLAPTISLARGWEKQLDTRYDDVLLAPGLTAAGYHAWLQAQAVGYVALPDAPLDPSSAAEGRLIRGGLPYLRRVFASAHWRVYRVLGATPLVQGNGRVSALGHDSFALRATAPGRLLVRVHYTRYWTITRGAGCVGRAPGGWTYVTAHTAGEIGVAAHFSLGRALGLNGSCSTGGGRASEKGASATRTADYRWLISTGGASPASIAAENAARGTQKWRLPGPPLLLGGEGRGDVEGYVSSQSISPGEIEHIYVNAPYAHTVRVEIFRVGWYHGSGGHLVLQSQPLRAVRQPRCRHSLHTGLTECAWRATLSVALPPTLTSGVYTVKLTTDDGAQRDCLFVVRSRAPTPLLVMIPTATYEAYNAWGGDSLYPGGRLPVGITGTHQGVAVSYARPYDSQTGAGQFFIREVAMVRFLERQGYPVSYTTSESVDEDPAQLQGVRAMIDVGHSEYWSSQEEQAFANARAQGTSLLFFSSDTLAWRVRFVPGGTGSSETGRPDQTILAYKEFVAADPDRAEPSGLFPLGGAGLVGSAYDGCITPRLQQSGPPVYRYYNWRPAPGLRPAWLFAHTGIGASTVISGIVGYELDERTPAAPAGTLVVGSGTGVPCQPETEPSPVRGEIAQSTLYEAPSGALVFSSGTLGWLYGLSPVPQASPDVPRAPDARVVAMTENLIARALHGGRAAG
jgi:N,N-dimethylformamidase beta subunit-like protein